MVYDAHDLRAEIARRTELPLDAVEVPFEVDPSTLEIGRRAVAAYSTRGDQVRALVETMFSGAGYALSYASGVSAGARETLRLRKGNCLSLASVFVGVARALGLKAYYLDASARVNEVSEQAPDIVVNSGHITAFVEVERDRWYLDVYNALGHIVSYRIIDDLEATAHFYNNRGYEALELARLEERPPDWAAAARDFTIATRIVPHFARAWNNLGVARARLGEVDKAEAAYREAMDADPDSGAPYNNLGSLYLETDRPADALRVMREAVRLEPHSAHAQFNLGRALLATGDMRGAIAALETAAKMRNESAGRMLGKLELYRQHPSDDHR